MKPKIHTLPLVAMMLAFASGNALAQDAARDDERPRISVIGSGEASGAPDLAHLSLTVLRNAPTAAAALGDSNGAAAAVADAMREFGIADRDLQTGNVSITPQYRYENNPDGTTTPPEIVGYEARNTLSVRVRDLPRLGEILDRAVTLGVNQGGDIVFEVDDPRQLQNEARAEAVEAARASAEAMAAAADRTLGPVLSIEEESAVGIPVPMAPQMRMMAASADSAVPIEIGENTISARVRVVYELAGDATPQ